MKQVRQRSLYALEPQDVPFEVLVDRQRPARSLSSSILWFGLTCWRGENFGEEADGLLTRSWVMLQVHPWQPKPLPLGWIWCSRWVERFGKAGELARDRRDGGVPY